MSYKGRNEELRSLKRQILFNMIKIALGAFGFLLGLVIIHDINFGVIDFFRSTIEGLLNEIY